MGEKGPGGGWERRGQQGTGLGMRWLREALGSHMATRAVPIDWTPEGRLWGLPRTDSPLGHKDQLEGGGDSAMTGAHGGAPGGGLKPWGDSRPGFGDQHGRQPPPRPEHCGRVLMRGCTREASCQAAQCEGSLQPTLSSTLRTTILDASCPSLTTTLEGEQPFSSLILRMRKLRLREADSSHP